MKNLLIIFALLIGVIFASYFNLDVINDKGLAIALGFYFTGLWIALILLISKPFKK